MVGHRYDRKVHTGQQTGPRSSWAVTGRRKVSIVFLSDTAGAWSKPWPFLRVENGLRPAAMTRPLLSGTWTMVLPRLWRGICKCRTFRPFCLNCCAVLNCRVVSLVGRHFRVRIARIFVVLVKQVIGVLTVANFDVLVK